MKHKVMLLSMVFIINQLQIKAQKKEINSEHVVSKWEEIYSNEKDFYSNYNQLLYSAISGLKPGTALDVAMGEGRNAIMLAQKGWVTTGFDNCKLAVDSANARAHRKNVKITTFNVSKDEFDFKTNYWDLVTLIYTDDICGGCCAGDLTFIAKIKNALKSGGTVVYEGYSTEAINTVYPLDSKDNFKNVGCKEYSIKDAFLKIGGFKIVYYSEAYGVPDWDFSQKFNPVKLIYFIGKKL